MSEDIVSSRAAIARIDIEAGRIKAEIQSLMTSDPRMLSDERFRNNILADKLREVTRLQEESQHHQRTILRLSQEGRTTRSAARGRSAPTTASLSAVASNIQQATYATRSSVATKKSTLTDTTSLEPRLSAKDQQQSIAYLLNVRNQIFQRESGLRISIEHNIQSEAGSEELAEYALIRSLRIQLDSVCEQIKIQGERPDLVDALKRLLHLASTRLGNTSIAT